MNYKVEDLSGKKFNKLTVIKRVERPENRKTKGVYWLCQCDCGNLTIIIYRSILMGRTRSCGCISSNNHFTDLTNRKFGKLTVIKRVNKPDNKKTISVYYLCKCDCGNEKIISAAGLRGGKTNSCGCVMKGAVRKPKNNLINKEFGRLRVIERDLSKTSKTGAHVYWICVCECGNKISTRSTSLLNGDTKSCGCLQLEGVSLPYGESAKNILFGKYKYSAKERGLKFNLTKKYFYTLLQGRCFYCNCEPSTISKGRSNGNYIYNGIDRIDSSNGYVMGNVVSCCKDCNYAKGIMNQENFINLIKNIYYNLNNKNLL